ncbi:N-acetyltransferase [Terrisporobacter glycolicus]|uniref:N-acetyltransferase n=1 Tax=Terrisporobacter glycolicus TaxID=36841 RepID=UPI000367B1CC|nr:N-acetyltransferase [Terrisporobacter glycolicus]
MIRNIESKDIDKIMAIWLKSTIKAHDFIDEGYWNNNYNTVKNVYIPMSDTFVYEDKENIKGFISIINSEFIGALFVGIDCQGNGVGKKLIDYAMNKYKKLNLAVYKDNKKSVNHDQVEAMTIGDRIALMNKGDLQMLDTPQNVYNKPSNIFTAKFIGSPSMNIFDVDYKNGFINLDNQTIDIPNSWIKLIESNQISHLSFGVRPEHVELSRIQAVNSFKGVVKYIEDYGNKIGVYFEIEGKEVIALVDDDAFKNGDEIYYKPNFKKIHLFNRETTTSIGYPEEI